ncbi:Mechanosensitive ion channel [Seminavis robusta]|uniref:Mechanosensitive ion channel n=1 Tax=Seminavis robusta TaxID=568900 RepID=A0A9N8DL93_9STRA|nr:Mechanosensitive ion channel [Seminavis robusta]|eukprot:Sro206_g086610.1 Mechanosensitive ion channel (439) ;mRNA; r:57447-59134
MKMLEGFGLNGSCSAANSTIGQCLSKADIREFREHTTLAGSIKQGVSHLFLAQERMAKIWVAIAVVVEWEELLFFFALGFLLPLALRLRSKSGCKESEEQPKEALVEAGGGGTDNSLKYTIANNVAQMAQLAFVVYLVDILKVVLQGIGVDFASQSELPHAFANIAYMAWILNRISALKRYVLAKQTKSDPDDLKGQVQLVDRLVDAFLYCIGLYVVVDTVQDDMGAAAKGFVALGSVGTMVIGLASQGLAAQLFNGLFLASSNRIAVGDFVKFSNGVCGKVIKLGWMETVIRGGDEIMITVPNKDLADQRVSNMSRVPMSAVKQTLRFKYSDIEKLPAVLETIKEEIKKACPAVVLDGSRPFRAHLTTYNADHIAANIDCRFTLKPLSNEFFETRQNVLLAIAKAVKQYDVEFAVLDVTAVSAALQLLGGNMKQTQA